MVKKLPLYLLEGQLFHTPIELIISYLYRIHVFQHIIKLILPMNTTPPKNISTIIQLYRSQLRIYRRFDTTYRLTDKFCKSYLPNYQPTPQLHQTPTKKRPPKGGPSKLNPIPHFTLHRFLIQILRNNNIHYCQTN